MSFDRETALLHDICDNIDAIADYIEGMDLTAFTQDRKSVDATERCLQRITEAVIRIGAERMGAIAPEIDAKVIRGMGNMLRHEYHRIDLFTVFETATHDLPRLRAACLDALKGRAG